MNALAQFVLVSVAFDAKLFAASYWGGEIVSFGGVFDQVRATMLVTVFLFIGVEGAPA